MLALRIGSVKKSMAAAGLCLAALVACPRPRRRVRSITAARWASRARRRACQFHRLWPDRAGRQQHCH